MSQQQFVVSHDGKEHGPMALSEIVEKVKSGEFNVMDYLYDEESGDWISFVEHYQLMEQIKQVKPKAPPKSEAPAQQPKEEPKQQPVVNESNATEVVPGAEWYVLKGENKFGPFKYNEVIKMLQEKLVFEFDFVWKNGMENWARIAEVTDFSADKIKNLQLQDMPEIKEVFFRRKHKRAQYNGTLLIHDNAKLWKGQALEVSAGGAGIVMENSMAVPGDKLHLHFKPFESVPAFNAVCEIVSKKFIDSVQGDSTPIRYGVKFTEINDDVQKALLSYANTAKAA